MSLREPIQGGEVFLSPAQGGGKTLRVECTEGGRRTFVVTWEPRETGSVLVIEERAWRFPEGAEPPSDAEQDLVLAAHGQIAPRANGIPAILERDPGSGTHVARRRAGEGEGALFMARDGALVVLLPGRTAVAPARADYDAAPPTLHADLDSARWVAPRSGPLLGPERAAIAGWLMAATPADFVMSSAWKIALGGAKKGMG